MKKLTLILLVALISQAQTYNPLIKKKLDLVGSSTTFTTSSITTGLPARTNATTLTLTAYTSRRPGRSNLTVSGPIVVGGTGLVIACTGQLGLHLVPTATATVNVSGATNVVAETVGTQCPSGTVEEWRWGVTAAVLDVNINTDMRYTPTAPALLADGIGTSAVFDSATGAYKVNVNPVRNRNIVFERYDFISSSVLPLIVANISGSGSTLVATTQTATTGSSHPGQIRFSTGSVANRAAAAMSNGATTAKFIDFNAGGSVWSVESQIKPYTGSAANATMQFGVTLNGYNAVGVAVRMVFERAHTDANWLAKTCDGAACQTFTSAVAVADGTWVTLKIESLGLGSIYYYINDVLIVTHSSNLPPNPSYMGPSFFSENTGNTALALGYDIDYLSIYMELNR